MIDTFFSLSSLTTVAAFVSAFVIGISFGWCLEQAGLGSSKRIAGTFYFADMSFARTIFSAVASSALILLFLLALGFIESEALYATDRTVGALAVGGILFGIGLVVSGWCPATAVVGVVSGKLDALVFILGLLAGVVIFNESSSFIEPLVERGATGASFFYEELGLHFSEFALAFAFVAAAILWASEYMEKKAEQDQVKDLRGLWVFSIAMLLFSCSLLLFDRPATTVVSHDTGIHASDMMKMIEAGQVDISPVEVARELIAGNRKILMVDLRSEEKYDQWHIRGARHFEFAQLISQLQPYKSYDRIILYSDEQSKPSQVWVILQIYGFKNVYVMTDGLRGFFLRVLKPASLAAVPMSDEEKLEITLWRAYFLGSSMAVSSSVPVSAGYEEE